MPYSVSRAARGYGMIGAGIWLYYLASYELRDMRLAGWTRCCKHGGALDVYWLNNQNNNGGCTGSPPSGLCGTGAQPFTGPWPAAIPAPSPTGNLGGVLHIGTLEPSGTRATWKETWMRPSRPVAQGPYPGVPLDPATKTWPWPYAPTLPQWWAVPWPLAPAPMPIAPPNVRPRPRPRPLPKPRPEASPSIAPNAVNIPVVEISPESPFPTLRDHRREPPDGRTRERKKRLSVPYSGAWRKLLAAVGTFTEFDDLVKALYAGLPTRLTRWRGRDGVWRQRDATTASRTRRLFDYIGSVNLEKAIDFAIKAAGEVAKNQLQDYLLGKLGQQMQQAGKNFNHSRGVTISRMADLSEAEWEARKQAERIAFERWWQHEGAKTKHGQGRWYWAKEYFKDGTYRWVQKERPKTQIPWYRHTYSYYGTDRTAYKPQRGY